MSIFQRSPIITGMKERLLSIDENKKKKKKERKIWIDSLDYLSFCIVPVCCKIAKLPDHNGRLLSLAVSTVLFLTIRSVVRSRWIVEGSRSDWPKEVGQDSVRSGSLFWEAGASQPSFFTRSRGWQSTAITLKGRNANIKPLYWIDWLAIGIIVCVARPPWKWPVLYATPRHRLSTAPANRSSGFAWAWHCQMM